MVAEKQIDEFVSRMKQAAGQNLQSVILYGSAATGEYQTEFSNLNLLCILRESSFSKLSAIAPVVEWWHRQKHPAPLVMTQEELEHSTDVFSIELLDMQHHHRVLFGDELLTPLQIPMQLHRAQLEYELREKLILLRQRLLETGDNDRALWQLLLGSVSAFCDFVPARAAGAGRRRSPLQARSHPDSRHPHSVRAFGLPAIAGYPRPQGGPQTARRQRRFHPLSGCRAARNRRSR